MKTVSRSLLSFGLGSPKEHVFFGRCARIPGKGRFSLPGLAIQGHFWCLALAGKRCKSLFCSLAAIAICSLPCGAAGADLNLAASGNEATANQGGTYQGITISGSKNPGLTVSGQPLTLTGTGAKAKIVTPDPSRVSVVGTALNLGASGNAPGGILNADVVLSGGGRLVVTGVSAQISQYLLGNHSITVGSGGGSLALVGRGHLLGVSAIGTQAAPLTDISANGELRIYVNSSLWAKNIDLSNNAQIALANGNLDAGNSTVNLSGGARLWVQNGSATLDNVNFNSKPTDFAEFLGLQSTVEAPNGNVEITGTLNVKSGLANIISGGDIEFGATGKVVEEADGHLHMQAGGRVHGGGDIGISGNITALALDATGNVSAANITVRNLQANSINVVQNVNVNTYGIQIRDTAQQSSIGGDLNMSGLQNPSNIGNMKVGGSVRLDGGQVSGSALAARDVGIGQGSARSGMSLGSLSVGKTLATGANGALAAGAIVSANPPSGLSAPPVPASGIATGYLDVSGVSISAGAGDFTASGDTSRLVNSSVSAPGGNIRINNASISTGSLTAGADIALSGDSDLRSGANSLAAAHDIMAEKSLSGAGLSLSAGNAIKAQEVRAASIAAGSVNVPGNVTVSKTLALGEMQPSLVGGNFSFAGANPSVLSGTGSFGYLHVGGSASFSGASVFGNRLEASTIDVGPNGSAAVLGVNGISDDANLGVGAHALASIGSRNPLWMLPRLVPGLPPAGALGLYSPIRVSSLELGGNSAGPDGSGLSFAPGSLLVVRAPAALEGDHPSGLISASRPAEAVVRNGSRIAFAGEVLPAKIYVVLGDNINTSYQSDAAWDDSVLDSGSHLIEIKKIPDRPGSFRTRARPASEVYPDLDGEIAGILDDALANDHIGTGDRHLHSMHAGVRFLSRASSTRYMDHDRVGAQKTLEGASRMLVIGAVPQMARAANHAAALAGQDRSTFSTGPASVVRETGARGSALALWMTPLFRSINNFDLHAGHYGYDFSGRLGGLTMGCDWTGGEFLRAGMDLSLGGGYAESGGELARTVNRMGFWGIGAYGGWLVDNLGLSLDAHYTGTWNDLEQDVPKSIQMRNLTGDATASALSGGLRVQYLLPLGDSMELLPNVQARYTWVHTNAYTFYSDGAVMDGRAVDQSIWTFPFGLDLRGSFETASGWKVAPSVKFAAIPAAGDIETRTKLRYTGTGRYGAIYTQTMDYFTLGGGIALDISRAGFSLGLAWNAQAGRHGSEQSVFGSLAYEF